MDEFLLILLGALIGAAASLTGSVIVQRINARRATRVDIYQRLLPPVLDAMRDREWLHKDEVTALYRAALVASVGDNRKVLPIYNWMLSFEDVAQAYVDARDGTGPFAGKSDVERERRTREYSKAKTRYVQTALVYGHVYDEWLAKRLESRLGRLWHDNYIARLRAWRRAVRDDS